MPEDLIGPALKIVRGLRDEIAEALAGAGRGERLRDGLVVAIAGPPNAGKSTLLNRIARREVAIVSPVAGTTRDVIEVHLDLDGYPVTLLDTAGVRDSIDPVEQEGVRRAEQRAGEADLVLWVQDAKDLDARGGASCVLPPERGSETRWGVWNKADLIDKKNKQIDEFTLLTISFYLSAATGFGVAELLARMTQHAQSYFGSESALLTRERHRKALIMTQNALDRILADNGERADELDRRGTPGRGTIFGSTNRAGRCRGHPRCHFPRFLHRKIARFISLFHVKYLKSVSRETPF